MEEEAILNDYGKISPQMSSRKQFKESDNLTDRVKIKPNKQIFKGRNEAILKQTTDESIFESDHNSKEKRGEDDDIYNNNDHNRSKSHLDQMRQLTVIKSVEDEDSISPSMLQRRPYKEVDSDVEMPIDETGIPMLEMPSMLKSNDSISNQTKLRKPQKRFFKKVQHDATTAYLYALGCSLVHFTLLVVIFFVKPPDVEVAAAYDKEFRPQIDALLAYHPEKIEIDKDICHSVAYDLQNRLYRAGIGHAVIGFI